MNVLEGSSPSYIAQTAYTTGELNKGNCDSLNEILKLNELTTSDDKEFKMLAFVYNKFPNTSLINDVYEDFFENTKVFLYLADELDILLEKSPIVYVADNKNFISTIVSFEVLKISYTAYRKELIKLNNELIKNIQSLNIDSFQNFLRLLEFHKTNFQENACQTIYSIYAIDSTIKNREIYGYATEKYCPKAFKRQSEKVLKANPWEKFYNYFSEKIGNVKQLILQYTIVKEWVLQINAELLKFRINTYICQVFYNATITTVFKVGFLNLNLTFLNFLIILGTSLCLVSTDALYTIIESLSNILISKSFLNNFYNLFKLIIPKKAYNISKYTLYTMTKVFIKPIFNNVCWISKTYLEGGRNILTDLIDGLSYKYREPIKALIVYFGGSTFKEVKKIPENLSEWAEKMYPDFIKDLTESFYTMFFYGNSFVMDKFFSILNSLHQIFNTNAIQTLTDDTLPNVIKYLSDYSDYISDFLKESVKTSSVKDGCSLALENCKIFLSEVWKISISYVPSCFSNFDLLNNISVILYNILNYIYIFLLTVSGYTTKTLIEGNISMTRKLPAKWVGKPIVGSFVKLLKTTQEQEDYVDNKLKIVEIILKKTKDDFKDLGETEGAKKRRLRN